MAGSPRGVASHDGRDRFWQEPRAPSKTLVRDTPTGQIPDLMPRPLISANLALSADGKISSVRNTPSGWTSAADHQRLLELRQGAGALLVGRGTLEADRMTLTAPGDPWCCVVSHGSSPDPAHPLFNTPGGPIHWLVTGAEPVEIPPSLQSRVTLHHTSLGEFFDLIAARLPASRLHCEGGGALIRSLAEMDALDELHLTLAGHTLFGGRGAPTLTGGGLGFLSASRRFRLAGFEPRPETGECFLTYLRDRGAQ